MIGRGIISRPCLFPIPLPNIPLPYLLENEGCWQIALQELISSRLGPLRFVFSELFAFLLCQSGMAKTGISNAVILTVKATHDISIQQGW